MAPALISLAPGRIALIVPKLSLPTSRRLKALPRVLSPIVTIFPTAHSSLAQRSGTRKIKNQARDLCDYWHSL